MKVRFVEYIVLPLAKIYWRIVKPQSIGAKGIVVYGNEILLVKNLRNKYWSLPGGGKKKKETIEECLLRELREELTLSNVAIEEKIGTYSSTREGKKDVVYVYVIVAKNKDFIRRWELSDAQWFPCDRLPPTVSPATQKRIAEYRSDSRNIISVW